MMNKSSISILAALTLTLGILILYYPGDSKSTQLEAITMPGKEARAVDAR